MKTRKKFCLKNSKFWKPFEIKEKLFLNEPPSSFLLLFSFLFSSSSKNTFLFVGDQNFLSFSFCLFSWRNLKKRKFKHSLFFYSHFFKSKDFNLCVRVRDSFSFLSIESAFSFSLFFEFFFRHRLKIIPFLETLTLVFGRKHWKIKGVEMTKKSKRIETKSV